MIYQIILSVLKRLHKTLDHKNPQLFTRDNEMRESVGIFMHADILAHIENCFF